MHAGLRRDMCGAAHGPLDEGAATGYAAETAQYAMILAGILSLGLAALSVLLQYWVTRLLLRVPLPHDRNPGFSIVAIVSSLLCLHASQIALFGVGHMAGQNILGLGTLAADRPLTTVDIFYYSAETFTTLGVGDIFATSNLRMLTSVESLTGILLLAWSASLILISFQRAMGRSG